MAWLRAAAGIGEDGRGSRGPSPRPAILAPAAGRRGLFAEWCQALGLNEVTETPSANGTVVYLPDSGALSRHGGAVAYAGVRR